MRISEIEKTLNQIHQDWVRIAKPSGKQSTDVYNQALQFNLAGNTPQQAHVQALSWWNSATDTAQDTATARRIADRQPHDFVGTPISKNKSDTPTPSRDREKTGNRGGQLGNTNAYKGGPRPSGKSLKQVMKDKWKEFNDQDGLAGKDAAKGMYIARTLGNVGKGIADMGDKFRKAPK
jgi:hypothetical protein